MKKFNSILIKNLKVKMSNQRIQGGGLWNSQRPNVSNDTQNLLKTMMQESKLTSFQQRTLNKAVKSMRKFYLTNILNYTE